MLKEYYTLQIPLNDTIIDTDISDNNRIIQVRKHQFVAILFIIKCLGNAMAIVCISHNNFISRNGIRSMFNINISFIELVVNFN